MVDATDQYAHPPTSRVDTDAFQETIRVNNNRALFQENPHEFPTVYLNTRSYIPVQSFEMQVGSCAAS